MSSHALHGLAIFTGDLQNEPRYPRRCDLFARIVTFATVARERSAQAVHQWIVGISQTPERSLNILAENISRPLIFLLAVTHRDGDQIGELFPKRAHILCLPKQAIHTFVTGEIAGVGRAQSPAQFVQSLIAEYLSLILLFVSVPVASGPLYS
jgi:hypothetical protein